MDVRVSVKSIQIIVGSTKSEMNQKEIQQFCSEKMQINIVENSTSQNDNKVCKVVLNRLSSEYIRNALLGNFAGSNTQKKTVKTVAQNVHRAASSHTKVRTLCENVFLVWF